MAARKAWGTLSATYRRRLERGGITKAAYERGESLAKARGHGQTPERPERAERQPDKYTKYIERRRTLERQVAEKKAELFRGSKKYDRRRSEKAIHSGPVSGAPAPLAKMERFLASDFSDLDWETIFDEDSDGWDFLYYH